MKKTMKNFLALLLSMIMVFSSVSSVFAAEASGLDENIVTSDVQEEGEDSTVWTADDFTYGEETIELYPAQEMGKKMTVNAWVITGLSDEGAKKIAENTDMVIPAKDPEGRTIQGVGKNALKSQGITSLTLPEGVKAAYDDTTWETTGKGLTQRGDFFVGYAAFQGNKLTTLELPEGVIYVNTYAFRSNQLTTVKLPKSLMWVASGAFAQNSISSLEFPAATDFAFQADMQAFAMNQIKAVQLPSNTEKLNKYAFLQNTGMEPITTGTAAEKKGGLVYMYMDAEKPGPYMEYKSAGSSVVQELILGTIPSSLSPWSAVDFTYDEAGTTITGLSDTGKEKLKEKPALILPAEGPTGEAITVLGDGTNMTGIFVYTEDGKNYAPESVTLPDTLTKIGKWTFALNASLTYEAEMTEITLPEGLVEIGQTAFQNSKLTAVSIPDSVTTMGSGTFTGSADLTSVKLSKNVADIPSAAFNAGTSTQMKLGDLVIPEGVKTIAANAFTGTHIESLTLPSTLTSIGNNAFQNHQLTELTIPGSVTSIGNYAFRISQEGLTKALTSVTLNEGLQKIGREAFAGNQIKEIELPSTVTLSAVNKAADCIFGNANAPADPIVILKVADKTKAEEWNTEFANSYSHVVVYDNPVSADWTADDFTYDEAGGTITGLSDTGKAKLKENSALILPAEGPTGEAITALGDGTNMTGIFVYTEDGKNYAPESVALPDTLTKIGKWTFALNASLTYEAEMTEITLPEGLVEIGQTAFQNSKLTAVSIPDSVTTMGSGTFTGSADLTSVKLSKNVADIPSAAFNAGTSTQMKLGNLVIPEGVKTIAANAFTGTHIESLTLPSTLTSIGNNAFQNHQLTEVTIPGSVTSIGNYAFRISQEGLTKALTSVTLNEGIQTIGREAFGGNQIKKIELPDTVTTLGVKAFATNGITELKLSAGITAIPQGAFQSHNLTELTIPGNVKEIGQSAFEGTSGAATLKSLTMEEGVVSIGKYAFKEALLENVHFPNSIKKVEVNPFLNNAGKDGSKVVEVTTNNIGHTLLKDETYVVEFLGETDIKSGEYYTDAVLWAYLNGITEGTTDTTFTPYGVCTRKEVVTFLWKANGCPKPSTTENPFADVPEGQYYTDAVLWAVENGITYGTTATTFSPNKNVTRAEFVTFLWRAEGRKAASISNPFTDVPEGQYYTDAVLWAVENEITYGKTATTFAPKAGCQRCEIVSFLYRTYAK